MPIELKITADSADEMNAIIVALADHAVVLIEKPATEQADDSVAEEAPKKTRARKTKPEPEPEDPTPVAEPVAKEDEKPEPAKAEAPKTDEVPSAEDLRAVVADAINKLPGGQDDVRPILAKFVAEGEKVILPNVPETSRAELIHMLQLKMEQA